MLIISEEQFLEELAQEKSESIKRSENNGFPVVMENHTYDAFRKPEGIPNIPEEVKSIIGAISSVEGNNKEIAKAFDTSVDTVGRLANDEHKNSEVAEKRVAIVERIRINTAEKIEKCVEFLTIAKEISNKELLSTAESLSRIHRNLHSPGAGDGNGNNVQFIYYAPEKQNKVTDYEIIDATT